MADTDKSMSMNDMIPPSLRGKLIGGEKITATATGLIAVAGVTLLGIYVAPILIAAITNLAVLGGLALGVGVVCAVLASHGFRSWAKLRFAMAMRSLHNQILKKRPYDVVRYLLDQAKLSVARGEERMGQINAAKQRLKATIDKHAQAMAECAGKERAARRIKNAALATDMQEQAGSLNEAITTLTGRYQTLEKLSLMIEQALDAARRKNNKNEFKMNLAIENAAALNDANAATKDALLAIYGDKNKIIGFEDAMNEIANQSAASLGEIEQAMHAMSPIIADVQLGRMVDAERGQEVLRELESHTTRLLSGDTAETVPAALPAAGEPVMLGAGSNSELAALFGRKP